MNWWHGIPCILQVKAIKSQVNLAPNEFVCIDNVDMTKMYNWIYFVNDILKSELWNTKFTNLVFPGFELKFQDFPNYWANSRPGKIKGKVPCFPCRVGTLMKYLSWIHSTLWFSDRWGQILKIMKDQSWIYSPFWF